MPKFILGGKMLDDLIQIAVGMGVPGLVLGILVATSGYAGGAAMTVALATLGGPLGMIGGITAFGLIALFSSVFAKYGTDVVIRKIIDGLRADNRTNDEIWNEFNSWPNIVLSKRTKQKYKSYIYD